MLQIFNIDINTVITFQSQPDYEVVENVRKLERISGSNYVLRKYKKKTLQGSGKTYVLNKKNTQICNKMLKY